MTTNATLTIRFVVGVLLLVPIVALVAFHGEGGIKGRPVALLIVALCVAASALAAATCVRLWRSFPAPFVAGVAGAMVAMQDMASPYGGVLGFFVGLFVVVVLGARTRNATKVCEAAGTGS